MSGIRNDCGSAHCGALATERLEWDAQVRVSVDQEATAAAVRQLSWRVYVTTQPPEQLSLQEAVMAYRNAYLVEQAMGRLKGGPLPLTPMYLEGDDHALCPYRCVSGGRKWVIMVFYGIY